MEKSTVANLILRIGVAFAFLYAAINAFIDPYSWIDYFPQFMRGIISDLTLLHLFGVVEIILGLWILSGKKTFIPSMLAAGMLVVIVLFNLAEFQLLFRDLCIATAALALAV